MPSNNLIKWDNYEYDVRVTIANNKKMVRLKPVQIQRLIIEKDFDNQILPIVVLEISKQESMDISIDNNTEFIISIDCFITEKNKYKKVVKKKQKRNIINDSFCVIDPDVTPSGNELKDIYQKEKKIKKNEITQEDLVNTSTYTLFRKNDLIASKYIFNAVLPNVTMEQTIATLLSNAGVSRVLMSNLDFVEPIEELLLMPMGLISQLKYLKNYYGWHKEDTIIFMDIDCMYIVRMDGRCTAWRDGEMKTVTFYINSVQSEDNFSGGMIKENNALYINTASDYYLYEDRSGVNEQTIGTNTILFNENTMETSTIQGITTNTVSSKGTTNIRSSSGHNKYLENWIKYRDAEQSGVVTITCDNIDFSQLTPNKEYRLISKKLNTTKKVQGVYRLSKQTTIFSKEGNQFMSKTSLELRKTLS